MGAATYKAETINSDYAVYIKTARNFKDPQLAFCVFFFLLSLSFPSLLPLSFQSMFRSVLIKQPFIRFSPTRTIQRAMSKSESEWKAVLTPAQFRVLRQGGTEAPYVGEYTDTPASDVGYYECAGCHAPLYKANTKFKAHCGWPAFYEALPGAIKVYRDESHGMVREEMRCATCDGHLGHIFKGEGYQTPTDERHCVNSISIKFNPEDPKPKA